MIDAPIAFDGTSAACFENTPIRYAEGGSAIFFDPEVSIAEIETTLEEDNVIVVLRPGA